MLKKYFIPLLIALVILAGVIYILFGSNSKPRDVRITVPVEHFKLSNGMTVVVMPNSRIPAVTHLLVVKAGSADDPYGKSGVAHYNEHMMFTGTQNYPEGVYDRSIARVGGTQNAYTTHDYTLFYATVAKQHLQMVMAMESDRLQHLEFTAEHAAREQKVITEERNMRVDNSAFSQLSEQLNAITFLNHPYHQPVIGWLEDMEKLTAQDAEDYFTKHYRATNMVLVVAGDVTVRDVRRYAQHYYGGMPGGAAPVRHWPKEPPVRFVRKAEMEDAKVHEPQLLRQYIAPSVKDGDASQTMPLALFAHYLGGGETSVLYEALVRNQKLATNVSVDYDPLSLGPALFRILATPAPGVSLEQLEQALDREIDRITHGVPDIAAITRSKTLLKADVIFAQDGLTPLAHLMGELYALGLDEQYFYDWSSKIDAVDGQSMLTAAQTVLAPNRRVTGYLKPASAAPMATTEAPHAP